MPQVEYLWYNGYAEESIWIRGAQMANEHGEWVIHGTDVNDAERICSVEQLEDYVNQMGFLPLFKNEVTGFSVEEHTLAQSWWTGDADSDPWEWRAAAARRHQVAYGKFFDKKAGFISLKWLPYFANYRRDGYDFDSLYEDGKASGRSKKLMDLFEIKPALMSAEMKVLAGFGKNGEKNFDGTITNLQMQTYAVMCDFACKRNKKGAEYGWPVAVYCMPEYLWGYDLLASAYNEAPELSRARIADHVRKLYPKASEKAILKLI